jgi:dynein heavy chain 2
VVRFHKEGKRNLMRVNYNPRLVTIIREVRQLSLLGYTIPPHVLQLSELAVKYMKQAKALDHVGRRHRFCAP